MCHQGSPYLSLSPLADFPFFKSLAFSSRISVIPFHLGSPLAPIGASLKDIETPALLIDLDIAKKNILKMRDEMEALNSKSPFPIHIRPHAKAHKCVELAKLQKDLLGDHFSGVCCQTVTEAETMALGGIDNILLTNEIASQTKARRIIAIHNRFSNDNKNTSTTGPKKQISVVVDSIELARLYLEAFVAEAAVDPLKVLIEVNVGVPRGGVDTIDALIALAKCTPTLLSLSPTFQRAFDCILSLLYCVLGRDISASLG